MTQAGLQLPAGLGVSTVLADLDFETYSEAGCDWTGSKWAAPSGAAKKGISAVGAAVYAEHPSTEVLCLAYDLKRGGGKQLWIPGMPEPADLFAHIEAGGLLEAWNCMFEFRIWQEVCHRRMGWPALPFWQLRDAMAKSRAWSLPGGLGKAAEALQADAQKDKEGTRLLNKFSVPRNPTRQDARRRILPHEEPEDGDKLFAYCVGDIVAEASVSARVPDLSDEEEAFWLCTMACNERGVAIDLETASACCELIDETLERNGAELAELTGGEVASPSQVAKLRAWLGKQGLKLPDLGAETIEATLARSDLSAPARRAVEIRSLSGSAGVKKVYSMMRQTSRDGRCKDLFIYHGARTGRDTGADVQPQNLVKRGPELHWCRCGRAYGTHRADCPDCEAAAHAEPKPWSWEAVEWAVKAIRSRSVKRIEQEFGDVMTTISGCIRGLFVADAGNDLIASDYSSIEAVVTAVLAGEQWRIDAFDRGEDIYLHGAASVTGRTYEWYMANGGKKHPDRQKPGKPAELGLGFGGWINAWRNFDSSDTYTDDELKTAIIKWRDASPMIVRFWGGQKDGKPWEPSAPNYYGLEGMAISAVMQPGRWFTYRLVGFIVWRDVLYMRLPSGRCLTYHSPQLEAHDKWEGLFTLSYMGWNSNPKMGQIGWTRIRTYGSRLAENCVQATARDVMARAVVKAERAGYKVVLRVHDELVAEVPEGWGSVEEFEAIMGDLPEWAEGWPIRAAGGWRAKRYRKD